MKLKRALMTAGVFGLLALGSRAPEGSDRAVQRDASCCYTHPSYTGTCIVEPAEDETCASILAYLNNPMSQGKSYCGGTKIRGGWKQVMCE